MLHKWRPIVLKTLLAAIIVYFVARSLPFKAKELLDYLAHSDYRFYLSMLLFAVFLMLQASIWVMIVNATGEGRGTETGIRRGAGERLARPERRMKLRLLQGLRIFIDSQFAKYIPGGVWNYAGRIVLAMREGVPLAALLSSVAYENVLLVAAALAYALVLAVSLNVEPALLLSAAAAVAAFAYVYYDRATSGVSRVFDWASRRKLAGKLLDRQKAVETESARIASAGLSRNRFFLYLIYFIGSHFVMGIAFWILSNSYGAGRIGVFYAAGTFAASWLLGLLSPLPGGLGVREGFLVYFLSLKLGTDAAFHISIIARLWNVMAEVAFWAFIQSISILEKRVRSYET